MDEKAEPLTAEEDQHDEQSDRSERVLTQRELVRASLLRCPPPQPADPPRRGA